MPTYKQLLKTKLPRDKDRRVKLTDADREEIRKLYREGGTLRGLGRAFGVDKQLIKCVVDPEFYEALKQKFKKRRKDGRYKPTRSEWATIQREHRRYKVTALKAMAKETVF